LILRSGKLGGSAATEVEVSQGGGWATSYAFSFSKGAIINAEITGTVVRVDERTNRIFYGSHKTADIIEGKMTPPDGSKVPKLLDLLAKKSN